MRSLSVQSDLRRAVANTKRGKRADGQQQRDILRKVEALEALDPTPNPVQSELLSGRWSLLYTGAPRFWALKRLHNITGRGNCYCILLWRTPSCKAGLHDVLLLVQLGPGKEDDTNWEKRTGGVEGPVLAALRPLSANAVSSKVHWKTSGCPESCQICCKVDGVNDSMHRTLARMTSCLFHQRA